MAQPSQLLQSVLGFQVDDLEANRNGELGPHQRAKIETTKLQALAGGGVFGIILIIFFVLLVRDGFTGWPIIGLCFGTMMVLLVGGMWLYITMLNQDLASGNVESITGPVSRHIRTTHTQRSNTTSRTGSTTHTVQSRHFYVQVGEEKSFKVYQNVYNAFEEGRVYEVFFMAKSNTIVAAVPLESASTATDWLADM